MAWVNCPPQSVVRSPAKQSNDLRPLGGRSNSRLHDINSQNHRTPQRLDNQLHSRTQRGRKTNRDEMGEKLQTKRRCCSHTKSRHYPSQGRPCPDAPVAELVDALELKIEFRKECWFNSGQGHHGINHNNNNNLSHRFKSRISPDDCHDVLKIQAKTHCSRPLCWYFCWYRQAKRAAANFDFYGGLLVSAEAVARLF